MEWLGRTIWPSKGSGGGDGLSSGLLPGCFNNAKLQHNNKMDHLYELRDLIQTNSHHVRAIVVDRNRPCHSSPSSVSSSAAAAAHAHTHNGPRLYSMLRVPKEHGATQGGEEAWLRCLREGIQVHQRVADHPHIVRLHQVYEDEEELCVVTDHMRGN
jgi:hypothetical protein